MKRIVIELIILCGIVAYLLISNWDNTHAKQSRQILNQLGNNLSSYFYAINMQAPSANFIDYKSDPDAAWVPLNFDGTIKANYLSFWQVVRTQAKQLYADNIKKIDIQVPVLHFRCSDTPFIRHPYYHLPKSASVKWMADNIKRRGFNNAIMLNCSQHFAKDSNSCSAYAQFYRKLFLEDGINVTLQCNSIMHDFALMVYSPLLVAINSSSFSFMAGMAKDPKDFMSCNLGVETTERGYVLQPEVDWIFDTNAPLLHKDVRDYNDVVGVLNLL